MNCRRARQLVFEFVDGLKDERIRLELENHLAGCGECEKLASQVVRSMDLVHRAPVETLDDNFNWKVRLAIHKERHALQENLASQGTLLRAWNLRYAMSAVAGFAMVIAAGWAALSTGVITLGGGAAVMTPTTTVADGSSANTGMRQITGPVFVPGPALTEVRFGAPAGGAAAERSRGALDTSTPVDLDSLVQAEMANRTDAERIQYLQDRIDLLQVHLDKCKARINE